MILPWITVFLAFQNEKLFTVIHPGEGPNPASDKLRSSWYLWTEERGNFTVEHPVNNSATVTIDKKNVFMRDPI
jgi:hypothetical protein